MSRLYKLYVLLILMLVYLLNVIDRSIITVLAPYIKADLGLTDAQLALLYGTAFALFYGLFGIPLARLADSWSRKNTLAIGLAFWSLMTCLCGCARSIAQLGLIRACVGVGEASASPAAVSLLSDYFSARRRGTVLAIYLTAIFLGGGGSLMLGGWIVSWWTDHYGSAANAPLGLTGWRAAFFLVGMPGLLLALIVAFTIREPLRDFAGARPIQSVVEEARTILWPWSYFSLRRTGSAGIARANLLAMGIIFAAAVCAIIVTDSLLAADHRGLVGTLFGVSITANTVQWVALAIAIYGAVSWAQSLLQRDPDIFRTVVGSKPYASLVFGGGAIAVAMYSVNSFNFLYAVRYLDASPEFGITLGIVVAICGISGTLGAGALGDWLKVRHAAGRVQLMVICYLGFATAAMLQYTTTAPTMFVITYGVGTALLSTWTPLINATAQDLLPEDMRGRGYAVLQLGTNVIGLGLGPYFVGLISDSSGSLRTAIISVILASVPAVFFGFNILIRHLRMPAEVPSGLTPASSH